MEAKQSNNRPNHQKPKNSERWKPNQTNRRKLNRSTRWKPNRTNRRKPKRSTRWKPNRTNYRKPKHPNRQQNRMSLSAFNNKHPRKPDVKRENAKPISNQWEKIPQQNHRNHRISFHTREINKIILRLTKMFSGMKFLNNQSYSPNEKYSLFEFKLSVPI